MHISILSTLVAAVPTDDIQGLMNSLVALLTNTSAMAWVAGAILVVQTGAFVLNRIKNKFLTQYRGVILVAASAVISLLSLVDATATWKSVLVAFVASSASKYAHDFIKALAIARAAKKAAKKAAEGK